MDIYRLSSDLKFVNQIGATLSIDERFVLSQLKFWNFSRLKLELALAQINESQKHEQILFWGRIEGFPLNFICKSLLIGTEKDYYIALGLNFRGVYEFPTKTFYYRFFKIKALNL